MTIQVQYYTTNTHRAITPTMYILPYFEGTIVAKPGVYIQQQGVISHENVLQVDATPPRSAVISDEITGGGPFSFLKNIYDTVAPVVEKALPVAKALAPVVGPLIGLGVAPGAKLPSPGISSYGPSSSSAPMYGGGYNEGGRSISSIVRESKEIKEDMRKTAKAFTGTGGESRLVGRLIPK